MTNDLDNYRYVVAEFMDDIDCESMGLKGDTGNYDISFPSYESLDEFFLFGKSLEFTSKGTLKVQLMDIDFVLPLSQ